ncbi:ATP-binding cassette domain-containing protein [Yinghuangia soli]|uniref:ATP-binding cassette domain-containing protein n=1 Tax=Yinghuangia soli TaxID=2908204 RepID=UPI003555CCEB
MGKRFRRADNWVLRDVDARLEPGRLVRVDGANGSGKSTLLRVIAGTTRPDRGRVHGRPPTAYVPERFPGDLPFTPADYLAHMGRIHGLSTARAVERAGELLELFGAHGYARTPMRALSKGTSQKVAVAQALLAEPGLLVLDEAWTGLDPPSRAILDSAVRERVVHGGTVVFVDHDALRLADTVDTTLLVRDGQVTRVPPSIELLVHGPRRVSVPASLVRIDVDLGMAADVASTPMPPALVTALRSMPGVRDVCPRPDGHVNGYRVDVDPDVCADVLRALLADPATRIRRVAEEEPGT